MTMVDFVSERTLKTIAWKFVEAFHICLLKLWLQIEDTKARIVLLVDLRELFFRFRIGVDEKIKEKALKMTS